MPADKDNNSKSGEQQFTIQPIQETTDKKFAPFKAHPGPAVPSNFNVQEEGTKEERRARAAELNKKSG